MVYVEERKNLGNIASYLEKMGIPYKLQDIGDKQGELFPAIICTYRCEGLDFDVILYNLGRWIHVKSMVLNAKNLTAQSLLAIYELSLELNYDLPECTFSVYNKNIFIEVDCLVDVDYNDFSAEFHSIGNGIEAFMETVTKEYNIEIQSTKGQIADETPRRSRNL